MKFFNVKFGNIEISLYLCTVVHKENVTAQR
jgi:hypothetical protein